MMMHFFNVICPGQAELSLVAGCYSEGDPVLQRWRSGVPRQEWADMQLQTTSQQALHGWQVNHLFGKIQLGSYPYTNTC